ncbi:glycosyltransferase [Demequina sp. NBRC 110056]|uniref:glycosyltransferase n=1 Tax=Demequina sp. NBRC 110056 TaxID=1570345 RepID=UPI000A05CC37|nr:glycosyltransferase [Demequina sp. NBRC 110056]
MKNTPVLVVGAHPSHGLSMRRYARLLFEAYEAACPGSVLIEPSDWLSRRSPRLLRKWVAYAEKLLYFPFQLRSVARNFPIVHIADHSDAIYQMFVPREKQTIVTCHDVFAIRSAYGLIPEHKTRPTGRILQASILRSLGRANWLVAVSEGTRRDAKSIGLDPRRMVVIPNPVDDVFFQHPRIPYARAANDLEVFEAAQVTERFALVVSSLGWRKRRWLAIEWWIAASSSPEFYGLPLKIVGPPLDPDELEIVRRENLEARVEVLADIDDGRLVSLYVDAAMLIQASRYEGFCWPIVEANACGTLAVCADEPVIRDTGAGNVFVSADSVPDWRVVRDAAQSDHLLSKLHERSRSYSTARFRASVAELAASVSPNAVRLDGRHRPVPHRDASDETEGLV